MTRYKDDWVIDIYWYEIIKNILSKKRESLFTIEIWEKMKDKYGYPYEKNRVEKELFNLQRSGYAISINKRGKQAWTYPTGEKLLILEHNKTVDSVITELLGTSNNMPTIEEIKNKIKEPIPPETLSNRVIKISKLIELIDEKLKKNYRQDHVEDDLRKKDFPDLKPILPIDERNMYFYSSLITELNGAIGDIDILTIVTIIDARKKYYKK